MIKEVNAYFVELYNFLPDVEPPEFNAGTLGLILITAGIVAAVFQWLRGWDKRKGFRMVLKDRNDKINAMWLEIIQDGVDDRLAKGKISNKEAEKMFSDAAYKMGLRDLVPKKRIAPLVKADLKRKKYQREQARAKGEYQERIPIPGDPPGPTVREKFSEVLGKTAAKFRRKTAA